MQHTLNHSHRRTSHQQRIHHHRLRLYIFQSVPLPQLLTPHYTVPFSPDPFFLLTKCATKGLRPARRTGPVGRVDSYIARQLQVEAVDRLIELPDQTTCLFFVQEVRAPHHSRLGQQLQVLGDVGQRAPSRRNHLPDVSLPRRHQFAQDCQSDWVGKRPNLSRHDDQDHVRLMEMAIHKPAVWQVPGLGRRNVNSVSNSVVDNAECQRTEI